MVQPASDGLVHHWSQGPRDQIKLYAPITYWERKWEWQYCWYLETPNAIQGISGQEIRNRVHYYLNMHGLGWNRSGVYFSEVQDISKAHVVLRLTDNPPVGWPDLPWGPGWAYFDSNIQKRVAQITSRRDYWDDEVGWVYLLNMELGGHSCLDMHDMYTETHAPYNFGCMGGWSAARANFGMPSVKEIESAKLWLAGKAPHIHDHGNIKIVGSMAEPHLHHS